LNRVRRIAALLVVGLIATGFGAFYVWGSFGLISGSNFPSRFVSIDKVALDSVDPPSGSSIYIVFTNETNAGGQPWVVNFTTFEAVSNTSSTYSEIQVPFSGINSSASIPAGKSTTLQLSFQMPSNQRPVKLIYKDSATGTNTSVDVPVPTSWVSKFTDISDVVKVGTGNYVVGIIAYAVLLNTTYASSSGDGRAVYRFFTGQKVTVGIEVEYYKSPSAPQNITINSINGTDGFKVISVEPTLPVQMTGWGSRAEVQVTFAAPAMSYDKGIHFEVGFTAP
jgi:hypothetical protein